MTTINLREFYPELYTSDHFIDLPDDVAAVLCEYKLKEAAYRLRTYRNKAYYSLDYGDDIENKVLLAAPSPFEIIERRRVTGLVYQALSTLPDKQARRIYAYYFLDMNIQAIADAEDSAVSSVHESIHRGLKRLHVFFEQNL